MQITASVRNTSLGHEARVSTAGHERSVAVPAKDQGRGSAVNGGELLMLALATCYCNDIFREAAGLGIEVDQVEVSAIGEFGAAGEPASHIEYRANVKANADEQKIKELIEHTDRVAEVHLTIRRGLNVTLVTS